MVKITFIDSSDNAKTIEAEPGATVMETAIKNDVPGIEAECGGACACATCHVYVDEAWREKTGGPSPMEEDMLDFGYDVRPNSRLSCQIKVTAGARRPGGARAGAAGLIRSLRRGVVDGDNAAILRVLTAGFESSLARVACTSASRSPAPCSAR